VLGFYQPAIAPHYFARTRRKPIHGGSCFSSMKNTVLAKVYSALASKADPASAYVLFSVTVAGHGWPEPSPMDNLWRVAEKMHGAMAAAITTKAPGNSLHPKHTKLRFFNRCIQCSGQS
jgi:hypothetical protein